MCISPKSKFFISSSGQVIFNFCYKGDVEWSGWVLRRITRAHKSLCSVTERFLSREKLNLSDRRSYGLPLKARVLFLPLFLFAQCPYPITLWFQLFSPSFHMKWSEVAQSCPTLCNPMDCSLPGSFIHGIFQARELEWVAISFSRGSSWPRDRTRVSGIVGRRFTIWSTREVLQKWVT